MTNILILDDDDTFRALMREFLKFNIHSNNYEASSGESGYEYAIKYSIDLFLVDLQMDGIDGIEFISMIRKLEQYQKQPILVVSGQEHDDFRLAAKTVGATGFINKPVDFRMLGIVIEASLNKWQKELSKQVTSG